MKNSTSSRFYAKPISLILTVTLLLLASILSSTSRAVSAKPLTGAIWTTDPQGKLVNGNLYNNPRSVYLAGGPHKTGALGLADGWYCFQVTDSLGKTVLSTDSVNYRRFRVENGAIVEVPKNGHSWNPAKTGPGIIVQLWPFQYSPQQGREYKVWVTRVDYYTLFGFIPSLSKTDNFKVNVAEVPKYFELWVTHGISELRNVAFYVNYTVDSDGDPNTNNDPLLPWTTGQLIFHRIDGLLEVFRDETAFAIGTYIYCQFFVSNATTAMILWTSDVHGPELISEGGMVNKEILFKISGHKYDNPEDRRPIEGWTISLFGDGVKIADTLTDHNGYYMFIEAFPGDYIVSCEGWTSGTQTWYEFEAEIGVDQNLDFYNYKMMHLSNLQDTEIPSFKIVFTPSNDGSGMYKLSSTNPGSFIFHVVTYGTPGEPVNMEITLPPDKATRDYDSPNFILHHEYIGSTPIIDVHVYKRLDGLPIEDITELFDITALSEKNVRILGNMPVDSESILVTVHIDYQISASLTWEEVQSFSDFKYTFSVMVYGSIFGGRMELKPTML